MHLQVELHELPVCGDFDAQVEVLDVARLRSVPEHCHFDRVDVEDLRVELECELVDLEDVEVDLELG